MTTVINTAAVPVPIRCVACAKIDGLGVQGGCIFCSFPFVGKGTLHLVAYKANFFLQFVSVVA